MSHALQNHWSAWCDQAYSGRSTQDYESSLHKFCSIATVEEFWGCYHHLPSLQALTPRSGYHLMKGDCRPMWEDARHQAGGVWQIRVRKAQGELVWKELLIALVSDQYRDHIHPNDDINGVSITNKQSEYLLQVWMTSRAGEQQTINYLKSLVPEVQPTQPVAFRSCTSLISA